MLKILFGIFKFCLFSVIVLSLGNLIEFHGKTISSHVETHISSRLRPSPDALSRKMDEAGQWAQEQAHRLAREHEQMLNQEREKLAKVISRKSR